jgi:hypothetical protein
MKLKSFDGDYGPQIDADSDSRVDRHCVHSNVAQVFWRAHHSKGWL